jgi:hypothetical protein
MRTIRRHNAGKKQAKLKMPKNGTFGLLEMVWMGERQQRARIIPMGHLISVKSCV